MLTKEDFGIPEDVADKVFITCYRPFRELYTELEEIIAKEFMGASVGILYTTPTKLYSKIAKEEVNYIQMDVIAIEFATPEDNMMFTMKYGSTYGS